MKDFLNIFVAKQKDELKLSISKIYLMTVLIILTVALGFYQYGISEYKKTLEQKVIFQEVENNKMDMYSSYRQYASFGFRVLFQAAPVSVFFTGSTALQEISAYIDSGERLNIYKPMKGKTVFEINKYLFSDFSGILLFFSSLMALLYGFTAFPNKEYQMMLASIAGWPKLFFSTLLARAIILVFFILLSITMAVLLIAINGLSVSIDPPLLLYFKEICSVSIFFLVLGSVFGAFELNIPGFIGIVSSLFSFLFIVPFLVSMIVAAKSDIIKPEYQLETEKLKLMMDFERKAKENNVILELHKLPADIHREYIMDYYQNAFQTMQKLENEMKTQMEMVTNLYYKLSSFFPTTEYLALTNEISSKGYKALDSFYNYVKQNKEAFFKEYMEKVYFSSQPAKVEPFLKGDENIFKSKPALPDYYLLGTFFTLLWIATLLMFSFYRFRNNLFELPKKEIDAPEPKDIKIISGKLKSWYIYGDLLKKQLYIFLSNEAREFKKRGYCYRVFLNDQELNTSKKRQNFFYLCHPKAMPKFLKVGDFLTLIMNFFGTPKGTRKEIVSRFSLEAAWNKKFAELNITELGNVFLAVLDLKRLDVYLLDDIGKSMILQYCIDLERKIFSLVRAGSTVLFLTTELSYVKKEEEKKVTFFETNQWIDTVKGLVIDSSDSDEISEMNWKTFRN